MSRPHRMICLTFLLIQAVSALSIGISISQFEDDNLYLQFYPFTAKNEKTLALKCLDRHFQIPVKQHLSEYRGYPMLRAKLGAIGVKTEEKLRCLMFFPSEHKVLDIPVRKLLGHPHQNELPEAISWPSVVEIDTWAPSPYYQFSDAPLTVIEKYEKIYDGYDFGVLDPGLRKANEKLKHDHNARIFLTLTTSPSRLKLLHYTLRSMDLTLVDAIFVSLPRRFKEQETYEIPRQLLKEFPELKFLSEEHDFGPISKIVSAVQFVHENYDSKVADSAIFISIDDDNLYSDRLIDTLAYHSFVNEKSVVAAAAFELFPFISFGIHQPQEAPINGDHLRRVASLEGFAGVAYRGWQVDWKLMKFLADKRTRPNHRYCYFSDDVVISNVLNLRNIQIVKLPDERSINFYSRSERRDLPHYKDDNSLQMTNENGQRDSVYMHVKRYQYCQMELLSYLIDFETPSLPFKEIPK